MKVSWPAALLKRDQSPRPRWRRFCWNGCGFSVGMGDTVTACCPKCRVGFVMRPVDERGRELAGPMRQEIYDSAAEAEAAGGE